MDCQAFIRSPNVAALFFLILRETDNGKEPFSMSYTDMEKTLGISRKQVRSAIRILQDNEIIEGITEGTVKGTAAQYTTLYKLSTCSVPKKVKGTGKGTANGIVIEQFETLWVAYKRRGSKQVALRRWKMLKDDERQKALIHAPIYRNTRLTQFCKLLEVYINQKTWEGAINTDYGLQLDPTKSIVLPKERLYKFYDWYNAKIQGTRITPITGDTEERSVLINVVFSYFSWKRIQKAIEKAVRDPYNSGALPITPGKNVQTFEEIMHPDNIIKVNE